MMKKNTMPTSPLLNVWSALDRFKLELILIVVFIVATFLSPSFLSTGNLLNVLRTASLKGVIAFGMTFVIICGEIDLSIGSTVGLSGIVAALLLKAFLGMGMGDVPAGIFALAATLILCSLIGLINGLLMTYFRMPSFIVTLGMVNVLYGVAALLAPYPVTGLPQWYKWFGSGTLFGFFPVPALFLLIFFGVTLVVLRKTKFGRSVYAVGGNAESARLSGINVRFVRIAVMMIVQFCAAFAGIMMSAQVMSGTYTFGRGWEMDVIASVIIGGASLAGGLGTSWGTFIGIIFLGIINNIMTLTGVSADMQYVVQGALIIGAVLLNSLNNRKKAA